MRYKIGVMGKAGRSFILPAKIKKSAEIIGKEIAQQNCVLITGACMGVANFAAKAASEKNGLVLAYSPAKNLKEHLEPPISYPFPAQNTELIFTGHGKVGRNVLSITSCDAVIFINGGIGSLNELTIAYHENKIIGILEGMEGVIEKVLKNEKDFKKKTGKQIKVIVIKNKDPKLLVKKVIEEIEKRNQEKTKELPITFKNKNNKQLAGVLHLVEKEKPGLAIICHGFQATKTDKKIINLARELQLKGICSFRFDFEGCGDSEGELKEITIKNQVNDLDSAFKAVQKEIDFNPEKIVFIGASLASVVISLFLKQNKTLAKSAVFWSQAFNQKELIKNWHDLKDKKEIINKGVIYKKDKEIGLNYYLENRNKDYSLILSELKLPVLIIHGKQDKDVPFQFSEDLAKKYKNVSLLGLAKANHKFNDYYWQKKLIKATVQWLNQYFN